MDGLIGYVLAKGYVDKTLTGVGAIRGASCQIHSITPVAGGNNVVFSWVDNSGSTHLSAPMFVADGKSSYDLWLAAGNTGTEAQFLASLKGAAGATGPQGPKGEAGPQGADGQDGVGIDRIEKVGTVDLVTTYKIIFTDGTSFEYEVKDGKDGKEGSGDSSVTLTQAEYEALTEEERLNGLYYTYDTKRIYKNGIQYGASDPISLTMEEYKALKEAGAIDEQQEYLIEANTDGILLVAEDIGYNNAESGIKATTVQGAIDAKLDKTFTGDDVANKILSTDEDGNVVLKDGDSGEGTAETTTYTNANYPDYTNVDLALDALFNKVYYVKPTCSLSATPRGGTFEMGTVISAPITFTWTTNKDVISQTLTGCTLANASIRTATYNTNVTTDKTFTLSVSDGENSASSSVSYKFLNNIFWGSATAAETYDSAFISALSNKKLASVIKGTYSFNIASGEYGFWAVPSNMTISSVWIGGFEVTVDDLGTVSYTNAQGYTRDYKLYKTGKASLGAISAEIK